MCHYEWKIFMSFTFPYLYYKIYNMSKMGIDESISIWDILIIINNIIIPFKWDFN